MIKIKRNEKNYIYTTNSERMDDMNNNVLMIFEDETYPGINYSLILDNNESSIINRIDKYEIEEDMNFNDFSIHKISFPHNGFYIYDSYEILSNTYSVTMSIDDLNNTNMFKWLERGRCKVYGGTNSGTQSLINDVYL